MGRVSLGELSLGKSIYPWYKKNKVKTKGSQYDVTKKIFLEICYTYNQMLSEAVLNGEEVKIPYRLASFKIRKKKMNFSKPRFDFGEFRKSGLKTYYINDHTGGYIAMWWWRKSKCIVKNKQFYCFEPTRENQRKLAKILKSSRFAINKYSD